MTGAAARLSGLDHVELVAVVSLADDEGALLEGLQLEALHDKALLVRGELREELYILDDLPLRWVETAVHGGGGAVWWGSRSKC